MKNIRLTFKSDVQVSSFLEKSKVVKWSHKGQTWIMSTELLESVEIWKCYMKMMQRQIWIHHCLNAIAFDETLDLNFMWVKVSIFFNQMDKGWFQKLVDGWALSNWADGISGSDWSENLQTLPFYPSKDPPFNFHLPHLQLVMSVILPFCMFT